MAITNYREGSSDPDDINLEVILQRIFNEKDPAAHRNAIWELLDLSGDWELFEKISETGGERGAATYFQNILDLVDGPDESEDGESDRPVVPFETRDEVRELYAAPLNCIRNADWAGAVACVHEILLSEIYEVYDIDEADLLFGDATAASLNRWVGEEVLFPLSIIEYMAYSDCLTEDLPPEIIENHLAIMLTLLFSAQAHMDVDESREGPGFSTEDTN
jgi:hypothetical protein